MRLERGVNFGLTDEGVWETDVMHNLEKVSDDDEGDLRSRVGTRVVS